MKEYIIPVVEVKLGNIAATVADAIVNPANSFGYMGGGVAKALKELGGEAIEEEAISHAPIQIGEAILTAGGMLPCKRVIHAPTMHNPGERTDHEKVSAAVNAALDLADAEKFKSIAMPGMGCGVGGLSEDDAAKVIVQCIKTKKFENLPRIVLVAKEESLAACFEKELMVSKKK